MQTRRHEILAFVIILAVLVLAVIFLSTMGLRGADDTPIEGDKSSSITRAS